MSQMNFNCPSHPHLFRVYFVPGLHSSGLKATRAFSPGETICKLDGLMDTNKAWYSLQCGKGKHINLNSDLAYVNHSCDPNIAFDVSSPNQENWHCRALKAISKEEDLTFFYPSTEWEMDQPFQCWCGAKSCLGEIRGAAFLSQGNLQSRGYVSPHIRVLAEEHGIWSK